MRFAAAALLTIVLAGGVWAHEKFKIVGTVAALKKDEIAIKAIDGATYEIDYLDTTVVTDKNHKKIDRALLKVGEKVVVLALGHDMFDLEAFEVQLTDRVGPGVARANRDGADARSPSRPDVFVTKR